VLLGLLYTAPNYFVDSPALQVTTGKATVKVNSDTVGTVAEALKRDGIPAEAMSLEGTGDTSAVRARFASTDAQFKAKLALERDLNRDQADPDYIVTVNLAKNTPMWMQKLGAQAMNLGLDLRGGVHFLLQVDAKAVQETRIKGIQTSARSLLRDKNVRHAGIDRVGDPSRSNSATPKPAPRRAACWPTRTPTWPSRGRRRHRPEAGRDPEAGSAAARRGRGREAEHQHPGQAHQRTRRDRAGDPAAGPRPHRGAAAGRAGRGPCERHHRPHRDPGIPHGRRYGHPGHRTEAAIPLNSELFTQGQGAPVVVSKDVFLTGDSIISATAGFDQNQQSGREHRAERRRRPQDAPMTRERVGKRMATC
jgi:preprotein translocase subunit SecD